MPCSCAAPVGTTAAFDAFVLGLVAGALVHWAMLVACVQPLAPPSSQWPVQAAGPAAVAVRLRPAPCGDDGRLSRARLDQSPQRGVPPPMALRVLVTHERFPPDFGGGGEYIVLRTAQGLMKSGVDVQVLTAGDPRVTEFEDPTQRLPVSRYAFNLQVRAIIRAARQADIIHTYTYHACLPSLVAAHCIWASPLSAACWRSSAMPGGRCAAHWRGRP